MTVQQNKSIKERTQKAIGFFENGYNCSQSVLMAYADLYGVDQETAPKPCIINQIVLCITNPRRCKYLSHITYTHLLKVFILFYTWHYNISTLSGDEFGKNL